MADKLTNCMWFDHGEARKAAELYASVAKIEAARRGEVDRALIERRHEGDIVDRC